MGEVEGKAENLFDLAHRVMREAERLFEFPDVAGFCREVYEDFVVVEVGDKCWKIPYSVTEDVVEFADRMEWVPVVQEWVETKGLLLRGGPVGMVAPGPETVKTFPDGTVRAYGLRFSGPEQRDLYGDYFTRETDFGHNAGNGVAATLNHRIPLSKKGTTKTQADALAKYARGFFKNPVKTEVDDLGILVEHVLDLSDEYEKVVFQLAERGKLKWSSGSAPHMVDREPDGKIKTWHILEWAYTPHAAEPRLPAIAPAKTLEGMALADEAGEGGADASEPETVPSKSRTRKGKMDEQALQVFQDQLKSTLDGFRVTAVEEPIKALDEKVTEFSKAVTELLARLEDLPGNKKAGYMTDDGGTKDPTSKSFGDFLLAIKRGDAKRLAKVYGSRIDAGHDDETKAMGIDSGSGGGYLVPKEFADTLLRVDPMTAPVLSRVTTVPVSVASGDWPALDQYFTPTAGVGDTAFAGGVQATMTPENATLTPTEPGFEMIHWRVHKIGGYTQVSNELISDSPMAIEALLRGLFNIAVSAKQEYFILRGSGVGVPRGILGSNAVVNVTPAVNSLFSWADVGAMQARFKQIGTQAPIWLIHPSVWPDILTMEVGTAGGAVWTANMQAAQGNTLNGYQIVQSEHLPQANNSGNVLLADLSAYVFFRRDTLSIAFSEHAGFLSDQGTWRFTTRADGQPWLRNPITLADPQGSYTVSPFVVHND